LEKALFEISHTICMLLVLLKPKGPRMTRLAMALFSMIATILASVGVVVVLVAGYGTLLSIVTAAIVGLGLAVPVTWYVVNEIDNH